MEALQRDCSEVKYIAKDLEDRNIELEQKITDHDTQIKENVDNHTELNQTVTINFEQHSQTIETRKCPS